MLVILIIAIISVGVDVRLRMVLTLVWLFATVCTARRQSPSTLTGRQQVMIAPVRA